VPLPLPLPLPGRGERAAISVVLDIAEGAGEYSPADRHRFYRMAGRSATETAAVLDILARRRLAPADQIHASKDLLTRVVSMLVRMIQAPMRSGRGMGMGRGTEPV
jgi:four helix bundle protein